MLMPFTPLRPIFKKYKDDLVVIGGGGKGIHDIAKDVGLKKYLTVEEYVSLWPQLMPLHDRIFTEEQKQLVTEKLCQRIPSINW